MKTILLALSLLALTLHAETDTDRIIRELAQPGLAAAANAPVQPAALTKATTAPASSTRIMLAQAETLPTIPTATPATNTPPQIVTPVPAWFADLAAKLPWLPKVLLWVGVTLGLLQPLLTFLHSVVRQTPTDWDDKLLEKIEASPALKYALVALKYLTGLNLVHPDAGTGPQVSNATDSTAKTGTGTLN